MPAVVLGNEVVDDHGHGNDGAKPNRRTFLHHALELAQTIGVAPVAATSVCDF